MKKSKNLLLTIGMVLLFTNLVNAKSMDGGLVIHTPLTSDKNSGGTGIVGSSHDLSNVGNKTGSIESNKFVGSGDKQQRICVYCHHPHNAYASSGHEMYDSTGHVISGVLDYSPLWNHELSRTNFVGYNNGVMMDSGENTGDQGHVLNAASVGGGTKIAGVSLLCMSCHDGVIAMNAYSQITGSKENKGNSNEGSPIVNSSAAFLGDMNNHHPMGFDYKAVQTVDAEIASTDTIMVPRSNITIGDLLFNDQTMECVTCHDVHNTANQPGAERFLWRTNDKSNFCLTCHLK
jgi:hypothetical protein